LNVGEKILIGCKSAMGLAELVGSREDKNMEKKSIKQIYDEYDISPALQTHMYRVAAVGSIICRNFQETMETAEIISACLLHDMGNIIKFNFDVLPELVEPQGKDYWLGIQKNFKDRYGEDEHEATYAIAKEIGVTDRVCDIVRSIGFRKACERYKNDDLAEKICTYADERTGPFGVLSLKGRIREGHKRFLASGRKPTGDERTFQTLVSCLEGIEKQIFSHLAIKPADINDGSVNLEIENLKEFGIIIKSA